MSSATWGSVELWRDEARICRPLPRKACSASTYLLRRTGLSRAGGERRPRNVVHVSRNHELLAKAQSEKAETTARRIEQFVADIERQISWATRASATTIEQRRTDYALLLQQVPAVERVIQLDGAGKEQLRLTRAAKSSSRAASTTPAIRDSRRRKAGRSGCRRSISTVSTRS